MGDVAALVLAAGRGSRFGAASDTSKVLAGLAGRALVAHVVDTALASRAAPVMVVTGQGASAVAAAFAGRAVRLVHNPDYLSGMAGSLKAGLAALPPEAEGALVLLGDMPLVRTATLDRLVAAFGRERPDAVVPNAGGRRGNPALLGRSLFPALMRLDGDAGARVVLADPAHRVLDCQVDDPGIFADVDTPAALAALATRGAR